MIKLLKALSVLGLLAYFVGCSAGPTQMDSEPGVLSLTLEITQQRRFLGPQNSLLLDHVTLNLTGPQTITPLTLGPGENANPIKLKTGDYILTVDGFNAENLALGRATTPFTIISGQTTNLAPVLTRLTTNGTVKLEAKTLGLGLNSPVITASLTNSQTTVPLTFTLLNNIWTATQSVAPGSYSITSTLKNGASLVATPGVESLLVLSGATTYGGISFTKETGGIITSITVNPPVVIDNTNGEVPVASSPVITLTPAGSVFINTEVTATITAELGATIHYTLDGTIPTASSPAYSLPLKKTHTQVETRTIKAFAVVSGKQDSPVTTLSYSAKDPNQTTSSYYKTNPLGQVGKYKTGMNVTCVSTKSDGFTDWSPDMIIAQGVANDDAKSFYGGHEYPSYDSYALYAAWDDTNLYLGWQFVYVNDVANPSNNGGNEAKPTNGDIPQMLAFDLDPSKATIGTQASGKNIWYDASTPGFNFDLSLGVDTLAMFSSKGGVGQPSLFFTNPAGFLDYTPANIKGFTASGIVYGAVDGLLPAQVWGVKKYPYVPADLEGPTGWVDFVAEGHNKSYDQFFEMKIPFTALGITRASLESQGIGVMHVSIYGTSGVNSLPFDKTTVDNALLPYSKDSSTSNEKEDLDVFTVPLARIGKL